MSWVQVSTQARSFLYFKEMERIVIPGARSIIDRPDNRVTVMLVDVRMSRLEEKSGHLSSISSKVVWS